MLAVVSSACGAGNRVDAGGQIWGRTFVSTVITEGGHTYQLVRGTRIRLTFNRAELAANAGCNHLSGRVDIEGERLIATNLGSTHMGCANDLNGQDAWLAKVLTARPTWQLDGANLVLRDAGTEIRLVDSRADAPDRPLQGTRWTVESTVDGPAVASVPDGAYVVFHDDRIEGFTGCNTFVGTATQRGNAITVSGLTITKVSCHGEFGRLEAAVVAVLDGEMTARVESDRLVLSHPSGRGLHLRA